MLIVQLREYGRLLLTQLRCGESEWVATGVRNVCTGVTELGQGDSGRVDGDDKMRLRVDGGVFGSR